MERMKKIFLTILFTTLFVVGVKAANVTYENIPGNSYVIGTHLYTYEVALSTKHIMLASKTIEGHTLNDMVINYKTSRGKWIDGLTGEEKAHLSSYVINYEDAQVTTSENYEDNYIKENVSKEDIPGNSYVIGRHLFTSDTPLSTKHIMLGAQTIDYNTLGDMKMYYKTSRGRWMDGLSGEELNVPDTFVISYVDLEGQSKEEGYVTLSATTKNLTYGKNSVSFNITDTHGGEITVVDDNETATTSLSGNKVTVSNLKTLNAGTVVIVTVTSGSTDTYAEATATYTITITKATLGIPEVSIDTDGVVTWTSVEGASSYEVSFDNINYIAGTAGNVNIPLTNAGEVTAYVRGVPDDNHVTSSNAYGSATVNVYSLTLTKDEGIDTVSGSGNYVSGHTATINATLNEGYEFSEWVSDGDVPVDIDSLTTTVTLTQNTSIEATSSVIQKTPGYVTLSATAKNLTYGTDSASFNITSTHGGEITVVDDSETATTSLSGNTVTVSNLSTLNAGTVVRVIVTIAETEEYTEASETYTITVKKAALAAPEVLVDTDGVVTWTDVEGALSYEVSFDNVTYEVATSGNVSIPLTDLGEVTAYVKGEPDANHKVVAASVGSATVNVYSLTITKDGGIDAVSGAGNYVSGKTVTISATLNEGYEFNGWSTNGSQIGDSSLLTTTVTLTQNTIVGATSGLINKAQGYITLSETEGSTPYGTDSITFTVTDSHGDELTVVDNNNTATSSVSGNTVTVSNLSTIDAETEIVITVTSEETDEYEEASATYTLTITKAILGIPEVSIDTDGEVTWTNVEGASSYEVGFADEPGWIEATSGNVNIPLTNVGEVTAYVRGVPDNNHVTTSNAYGSATVNVYSLMLTGDPGIDDATGSGNYVSGKEVTISATLMTGYTFIEWSVTNGDTPTDAYSLTTTVTLTQNTSIEATSYAEGQRILSIRYNGNGGTWNNPVHNMFDGTDPDGFVRRNGEIFAETLAYGQSLSANGLLDYNAGYLNWVKTDYSAPSGQEYIIDGTSTTINQAQSYVAEDLADYVGCDLSSTDCEITVNVNWKHQTKVGTFNVGFFECGDWIDGCSATPSEIVDLIDQNNLDIIGMQEVKSRNVGNLTAYASQIASTSSLPYNYITTPDNVNMMMSKYNLQNTTSTALTGGEERSLDKSIININGVDISFYNTHLGLNEYNDPHFSTMANILSSDSNPIIVTGDFNETTISKYTEYLVLIGFEFTAYNNTTNKMENKKSYYDCRIKL
jgi:hypothetical protein